jgi:hypothetical protein
VWRGMVKRREKNDRNATGYEEYRNGGDTLDCRSHAFPFGSSQARHYKQEMLRESKWLVNAVTRQVLFYAFGGLAISLRVQWSSYSLGRRNASLAMTAWPCLTNRDTVQFDERRLDPLHNCLFGRRDSNLGCKGDDADRGKSATTR